VAYCSLEHENSRVLEVPLWMLDVAACSKTQVSKLGFVSADSDDHFDTLLVGTEVGVLVDKTSEAMTVV
jgi:hypothetical protein